VVDSSDSDDDLASGLKCARVAALRVKDESVGLRHVDDFNLLLRIIDKFPDLEGDLCKRQSSKIAKLRENRSEASEPDQAGAGSS
jgi:hypothetical protein